MKKRFLSFILTLSAVLTLCACSFPWKGSQKGSTFSVEFIDVGQGDAALIECDGHYMLIDGGTKGKGGIVYSVLEERKIQHLDILAMSHLDEDHIGGLAIALTYASKIDLTIANSDQSETKVFQEVQNQLSTNNAHIHVPRIGEKYDLGSAEVEVVWTRSSATNDSLVLLVTYGKTRFLFTGDIEGNAQKSLTDQLRERADYSDKDNLFKVNVIKMPHHGAYNNDSGLSSSNLSSLITLLSPDYAVISVGTGHQPNHPHEETLKILKKAGVQVCRTDINGNITIKSDGKHLSVKTTK